MSASVAEICSSFLLCTLSVILRRCRRNAFPTVISWPSLPPFYDSPFPVSLLTMKNPRVTHRRLLSRVANTPSSSSCYSSSSTISVINEKRCRCWYIFLINSEIFSTTRENLTTCRYSSISSVSLGERKPHECCSPLIDVFAKYCTFSTIQLFYYFSIFFFKTKSSSFDYQPHKTAKSFFSH